MPTLAPSASIAAVLFPELLLSAGAMLLLMYTVWRPQLTTPGLAEGAERTGRTSRLAAGLCGIVAIAVMVHWMSGARGSDDSRIAGDGFRWAIDLIVLAGTAFALILVDADHQKNGAYGPEVPVLMLLSAIGMMVLAAARDLMFVFLGVELMSLAVYVLAAVNRRSARGAEAAIKYFLLGAFSTGFLLYGMALIFGATGSTRLVDIAAWSGSHPGGSALFVVGTALLLVGFAFKVAAAPFHLWTPDVYDGASLPVTAFMAAAVKTAAFAMFVRVVYEAFGTDAHRWHAVLWWMAALTMIVGNVLALAQKNLVRMLAYSSIAHAGYLLVALLTNSVAGSSAIVFYLVAYTLTTMGTFAVLVSINAGRDHSPTRAEFAGLWRTRPALAGAMAVFMLSFLGFPVAGGMGFFAKWYVILAALRSDTPQTILAIILVLTSVVSAGYYLSVIAAMFMEERADGTSAPAAPGLVTTGLIVFAVSALLVLGIFPSPVVKLAHLSIPAGTNGAPAQVTAIRP